MNETNENELNNLNIDELKELKIKIDSLILAKTPRRTATLLLSAHPYKGSGKCWVAEVDPENGYAHLAWVEKKFNSKEGNYSHFDIELQEGKTYKICDSGSKSSDNRRIVKVENGEIKKITSF